MTFTVAANLLKWNGTSVRLRGVAVGDSLDARAWRSVEDYATLAENWNCNVVRISVQSVSWRDDQAAAIAALEPDVEAALAADMWVIICWHVIGWPDGTAEEWYDSSFTLCTGFWSDMAVRYGAEPRILFELWNEPLSEEAYSSTTNVDTWPELKARYEELIAIIRAESDNVILCAGDMNTYDLRGIADNLIVGDNIAYIWHVYPLYTADPPIQQTTVAEHQADWTEKVDGLTAVAPVVCTEWGYSTTATTEHYYAATTAAFGTPLVSRLSSTGMHWTAWCWHPEWGPSMLTGEDWDGTTVFGAFVKSTLLGYTQVRPSYIPPPDEGDPPPEEEPPPDEEPPSDEDPPPDEEEPPPDEEEPPPDEEEPPLPTNAGLRRRVVRRVPAMLVGGLPLGTGPVQTVRLKRAR